MNVHIYPSTFRYESRILREVRSLVAMGVVERVEVVAVAGDAQPAVEALGHRIRVVRLPRHCGRFLPASLRKIVATVSWSIKILWRYRRETGVVNCHSLATLPVGLALKGLGGWRCIYDAHELETETQASSGMRKVFAKAVEWLCMLQVDALIVVSPSIAAWYERRYPRQRAYVVRNIPSEAARLLGEGSERHCGNSQIHDSLDIPYGELVLLYHGILEPGRGIGVLLQAAEEVGNNRHFVFMGYGSLDAQIRLAAEKCPNVHLLPAVSPDRLLGVVACSTVGLVLIENVSLSYYYCLPNKLFECIAAGVPVIVSAFPDLRSVVEEFGCGWVIEPTAEAVARTVRGLRLDDIAEKKLGIGRAREALSWDKETRELAAAFECAGSVRNP